jgi:hypothetical protein
LLAALNEGKQMQSLVSATTELKKAKEELVKMGESKSLDDFEESWKQLLHRIERAYNKATHQLNRSPKFQGWNRRGQVEHLRKKDPLLSYLKNARGADEHTINDITSRSTGGVGINPHESANGYIGNLEIRSGNGRLDIKTDTPLNITFYPEKTELVAVENRGRKYEVPTHHLSEKLDSNEPLVIASKGIDFYEVFLSEAEAFFCK